MKRRSRKATLEKMDNETVRLLLHYDKNCMEAILLLTNVLDFFENNAETFNQNQELLNELKILIPKIRMTIKDYMGLKKELIMKKILELDSKIQDLEFPTNAEKAACIIFKNIELLQTHSQFESMTHENLKERVNHLYEMMRSVLVDSKVRDQYYEKYGKEYEWIININI